MKKNSPLTDYFLLLIEKVERSEEITNAGKDDSGFYKPTKTILLQKLNLLKDLHENVNAKPLVQAAWNYIVEELPPEWLILEQEQRILLKAILGD
jgi:transcriptional regulator CtsR